jgi:hypothetical protein
VYVSAQLHISVPKHLIVREYLEDNEKLVTNKIGKHVLHVVVGL